MIITNENTKVLSKIAATSVEGYAVDAEQTHDPLFSYYIDQPLLDKIKNSRITKTGIKSGDWVQQDINQLMKQEIAGLKDSLNKFDPNLGKCVVTISNDRFSFINGEGGRRLSFYKGLPAVIGIKLEDDTVEFADELDVSNEDMAPSIKVNGKVVDNSFIKTIYRTKDTVYYFINKISEDFAIYSIDTVEKEGDPWYKRISIRKSNTDVDSCEYNKYNTYWVNAELGDKIEISFRDLERYGHDKNSVVTHYWVLPDTLYTDSKFGYRKITQSGNAHYGMYVNNRDLRDRSISFIALSSGLHVLKLQVEIGSDYGVQEIKIYIPEKTISIENRCEDITLSRYSVSSTEAYNGFTLYAYAGYNMVFNNQKSVVVYNKNTGEEISSYTTAYTSNGKICMINIKTTDDISIHAIASPINPDSHNEDNNNPEVPADAYTTDPVNVVFTNTSTNPSVVSQTITSNQVINDTLGRKHSTDVTTILVYKYKNTGNITVGKLPVGDVTFDYEINPILDENDIQAYEVIIYNVVGNTGGIAIYAAKQAIPTPDPQPDDQPVSSPSLAISPNSNVIWDWDDTSSVTKQIASNVNWAITIN